jgi:cytochrome c2
MSQRRWHGVANALQCVAAALAMTACAGEQSPAPFSAGDIENGRLLLAQYQCGSCHVIPGVRAARGVVGPGLGKFSRQVYIAGELPNDPETLVRFIQDPPALVPGTAMPDLSVTSGHARSMAAYLYSLEP